MSADNGIYILKTKDQYRVTHEQAIENIYDNYQTNRLDPLEVVRVWGFQPYTRHFIKAMYIAEKMDNNWRTEYGIKIFTFNKTWKHILEDAKQIAKIKLQNLIPEDNFSYKYHKNLLEKIINM